MKPIHPFAVLVLLVLSGVPALMSQTQGRVTGRVTDTSGAVIVGAKITIENRGTQVKRVLDTNSTGEYVAPGIEPGIYRISVEALNFRKVVRERVEVEVAKDLQIDFELPPGAANQVLEVNEEAPLVDAATSTLNGVLSNKAINELPLQGRDFQNLLALHPGVQREPGGGFHSVTSNGLRPDDNNFVIDGATDNDAYYGETVVNDAGISGTPASTLPLDAIQEFNTQEQPQADFGDKPGVVVNIGIKSGTDQIHGTAYYFGRNAALDARNYFNHGLDPVTLQPVQEAALILHQFGASIGGPIIKGKWFYFANYEGVRSKVGNPFDVDSPVTSSLAGRIDPSFGVDTTQYSIVDAEAAAGCNANPSPCSALSLALVNAFPVNPGLTVPGSCISADNCDPALINFDFNNVNRADNLVFKSDYHWNEHHVFTGRFIYANSNQIEEDAFPLRQIWLSHAAPITQIFGVDWTWTPNSRLVNVARFSYNRFTESIAPLDANVNPTQYGLNTGITDPRLFGFPRINPASSVFNYLGGNSSWPLDTTPSHTENYSDTVSYTVGKHAFRFGGVFSNGGVNYFRASTGRGRIDFHYLPDFLAGNGNVHDWSLLYGDPGRDLSLKSFGLFVQDDFRATRRLTLNLGLRYDVTFPLKDQHNQLANFVPNQGVIQVGYGISEPYQTNWTNFSPRLGAAFDVFGTGKTILRAGFGLIYVEPSIRTFAFGGGGLNLNPSALIQPGANGTINSFLLTDGDTSLINWCAKNDPDPKCAGNPTIFPVKNTSANGCNASSPCTIFGVDRKLKTPYVMNWNVNLQQQLTPGTLLQIAYVANRGQNLYSILDLNQPDQALSTQCVNAEMGYENADITDCEIGARPLTNCTVGAGKNCFPYISYLNFLGNKSTSSYQSLQVTLTHRYSRGLYLLAGYTWGHAIDVAGATSNTAIDFIPQNSLDYQAEKGNGDYDIRHRFTASATYDLPSRKFWGQLLEGWQLTSIFQWQTGPPILLFDDFYDLSLTGEGNNASNERWNIKGDPGNLKWSAKGPIPFLDPSDPICQSAANTAALKESLGIVGGCFAQNGTVIYPQAVGTFGNMGRNIFRGPGFVNLDASISKIWRLGDRVRLQVRGEMFNVVNHANFAPGSVGSDLTSPDSLGRASAAPDVQASNPVIGSGGSRHIQLGAKIIW
jgi:Carboxypeptidase regulatory-like domain/TonB dependent receptor